MAGRVHVDVSERRLRPIYDCLDNGNNKEAIKEADKVLKKQKNFQCAKVLKALALLRTGKQDESCNILKAVHAEHPTDDSTLQAMVICYKEMHELDQIATLYENASKAQPDNEEILSALFMAYVRVGNYKKQQQTAMALHRLQPHKNPYYFWAVMSIVMQAHETENLAKTMFLPLAERMAQKYVKDDKIEAEAEVQLYLMILDLLDKPQEALKMVEGPLGGITTVHFGQKMNFPGVNNNFPILTDAKLTMEQNLCQTKRGELCIQLKKWPQANMIFRQLLLDNPDNWYFYSQYLKSLFALIEQDWSPEPGNSEEGPIDNTVEKALNFISERIEETKENQKPQRGPYLARLELYKLLRQSNKPELDKLGSAFQLLEEYFDLYGTKPCCFMDLKPYMCLLEDDEKQKWCNFMLEKVCLVSGDQLPENQKHMQQHLNVCQLQRHIGEHNKSTHEEKLLLIQQLFKRYKHGLQFGQELLITDLQHSDNYLLLAVHLLVDVWRETGQQQFLREAIVQLEEALQKSPSSFQFKMALIKLYCLLGAFGPCPAVYDSMDIKHIQNDTLGYLVSNSVSKLGFLNSACAMYGSMLRFFSVNHKDTTEYLIQAYRYGSFTKVQEFVRFRERLQQSLQYASATEERRLLDLTIDTDSHSSTEKMLSYMDVEPDKDTISWAKLRDNRDLEAMLSWDPEDRSVNEEVKKRSEEEEIQWLKIRNLTFRCLAASVMLSKSDSSTNAHVTNNTTNDNNNVNKDTWKLLERLCEELRQHLDSCKASNLKTQYPLSGPCPTRLSAYLQGGHGQLFVTMVDNVLYVRKQYEEKSDKGDPEKEQQLASVHETIQALLQSQSQSVIDDVTGDFQADLLEKWGLLAETLAYLSVLLGVCNKMLKPWKTSLTKKKKKKNPGAVVLPATFDHFNTVVQKVEHCTEEFHKVIQGVDAQILSLEVQSLKLADSLQQMHEDSIKTDVWKKIQDSYQQSAKELSQYLQHKIKYLHALKL